MAKKQYQLVSCTINGREVEQMVDVRASLTDMLRNDYHLADRGHKRQQQSCALADARHLHQLLARGEERPLKRAEAVEQRVGQLVRVAPRDGVVEQQLQHLVLREAVQSVAGEALLHALAVPVVQTHADPSFRSVGSGQRFSGTGCRCPWRPCRYRGWPSASE